jgi:hypothetical protein
MQSHSNSALSRKVLCDSHATHVLSAAPTPKTVAISFLAVALVKKRPTLRGGFRTLLSFAMFAGRWLMKKHEWMRATMDVKLTTQWYNSAP